MADKYQRGKIYKIISPHTDCIYIGSTTEKTLACRMREHRSNYRRWKAGTFPYLSSFDMIETGNESIILIEAYPCNSKDELRAREQHHIDLNAGLCINTHKAYLTPEQIRAQKKVWMNGQGNAKCKCLCGGEFGLRNKARHNKTPMHTKYIAEINDIDWLNELVVGL
jgi:hypothetical protein